MKNLSIKAFTILVFIYLFVSSAAWARILVIAPHPDDDLITSAGIIYRAAQRGEPVRVAYMTNGDLYGGAPQGHERENEAVTGESILGIAEDNLIFLGYPDGYLNTIYAGYLNATDQLVSSNNISATYGNRGLGRMDYHTYRFGSPASYNRANIVTDLADIISNYLPDQIFVTSEFDTHPDHSATYRLLRLALSAVHNTNSGYLPIIHKTLAHWNDNIWPNAIDPTSFTPTIPTLSETGVSWVQTGLVWADRESIDVPLPMQSTDFSVNPKFLSIAAHIAEGGTTGFLGNFIHKDEIFWSENVFGPTKPPIVNAGMDLAVAEGVVVSLDGSMSRDPDGNPLAYQWVQRSGSTVTLANPTSIAPTFTAPMGLTQDQILTFELVVTNGQFSSVPDSVSVTVHPLQYLNIAPLASATASSEASQYGQTAAKAIDGVIAGYPGDYTREWATNGQGVGARLSLNWPAPYTVNQIVLYDRPNSSDNIQSATITFSDNTSITVGPLNNGGSATTYTFPARTITGLTMTVTGVSSSTVNAGLAEIQVFGTQSSGTQVSLTTSANPSAAGSVITSPNQSGYYSGSQVTLTAVPNTGYAFSGWSGDASGTTNPLTITMSANTSITANFMAIPGTLSVTPTTALAASGTPGGSFAPSSSAYIVQNGGNTSIDWSAAATQSWVTVSPANGTLMPGASTTVTVSINNNANALPVGVYNDTVTFINSTNGTGNTSRGVSLSVALQATNIAPLASATASSEASQYGQTAAKAIDGVIAGYPGDYTREWATNGQGVGARLSLNWPAPYTVNQIVLYDRPNSSDNIQSATITFSDNTSITVGPLNNGGSATTYTFPARTITGLTMTVTGVSSSTVNAGLAEIQVFGTQSSGTQVSLTTSANPSAAGSVITSPNQSGYYSGSQVTLTAVPNTGYAFSGWSGDASGTTNPLTITMSANTSITANFMAIPGTLSVTPTTALAASGTPGGSFAPSSSAYIVQNGGNTSIDWSAAATQSWVTVSPANGTLMPGASTTVTVSINNNANALPVGVYNDTVTFINSTNGTGNTSRGVSLSVALQATNIAPLASATASSEASQYGQTAAKAIDGVIAGYPGDYTREWATNGQGVGARLSLNWPAPYTVNQIVLYDRPNSSDNIQSATITFSDNTSITVGPLNNGGSATTYTFPARTITGLTMTVTGVSSSTVNAGLAEIQVFGTQSSGTQVSLTTSANPSAAGSVITSPNQSGYYSGSQVTLTAVPNTGYAFSGWSGDASGTTNPLTITMSANTSITANFMAIPGTLAISPAAGLTASGALGGPFTPSITTYTLQNRGNTVISWSTSTTWSWVTVSPASGSLEPGASATVAVSINSNANTLASGHYSDTVTFTNTTNGSGNDSRGVALYVDAITINSTSGYTPLLTVNGSPMIQWIFPDGSPSSSTSATPGAITFPDSTPRTSILFVNSASDVTNFEIDLSEQTAGQQSTEIQSVIGLEQLTGLTRLFLYDTGLTSLPNVNQLSNLREIYCSNNFLGGTNLRWNGLTRLTLAHAFGNNLSAQEVDQLFIDLDNNGVSFGEFNLSLNAGPSAASATARANLVARGNALTYNTLLSNPGYVPAVSTTGANVQVSGSTTFTVTAPEATDIKVDIQDLGVQHIASGGAVTYYLGNPNQIRSITIEVSPASALTSITFEGSGRLTSFLNGYIAQPNGNIRSISGLDRFVNLQHLAFYPANLLTHIQVPNGVGANLTNLELLSGPSVTSPLSGADADALIAALAVAGSSNGLLYIPNRTTASDGNVAILRSRGWSGAF